MEGELASPSLVAEFVNETLMFDWQNHPERFGTADIIQFKNPKHTEY